MRSLSKIAVGSQVGQRYGLAWTRVERRRDLRGSGRLSAGLAAGSLLGLVAASLLIVVIAADRPSFLAPISRPGFFPIWMAGPLHGLWPGLTESYNTLVWLVSGLMGAMYVLYIGASANAWRLRARWTILTVLALHAIFLIVPPLSYTDVFNYINYGRMGVVHHLNPYTTIPLLEPHSDPSFALSNWHRLLSPYGPLFTIFTYALVPLGVVASFWTIKVVLAVTSLATLALVWRCAEILGRSPASAVVFVGCNPIVLIWELGADHNDILMMFFVVLAAYLLLRVPGSSLGAGAALVAAVFIKVSAAVLLPIFLLATPRPRRPRFLSGALGTGVVLALASVIAFGLHPPGIATQSELVTGIGVPNLLGLALGLGGETTMLHAVLTGLMFLTVIGCSLWVARRPRDWIAASGVTLLVVVLSLSWEAPWYLLWVLPFAALSGAHRLRRAVLIAGAFLLVAFMPAASTLASAIHFDPQSSPLGMEHRRLIETLLQ
jgi:hypothetical protein